MTEILPYWPVIVSLLCGLLLAAVILALILMPDFRRDMTAQPGKASLLDIVSIEGVVVVLLSGMLLVGLIYPLWSSTETGRLEAEIQGLENQLVDLKSKEPEERPSTVDLPAAVAALERDSDQSEQIRNLARERKGPWSPFSKSKDLLVSVPGGLKPSRLLGCPDLYGKSLQLISTYRQALGGEPLTLRVNGLIFEASDCRDKLEYDLKLNCADASALFSADVLECDGQYNTLWKVPDRYLSAAAVIANPDSGQTGRVTAGD